AASTLNQSAPWHGARPRVGCPPARAFSIAETPAPDRKPKPIAAVVGDRPSQLSAFWPARSCATSFHWSGSSSFFRSPFKPSLERSVDLLSHCSRATPPIQCVFQLGHVRILPNILRNPEGNSLRLVLSIPSLLTWARTRTYFPLNSFGESTS